jgi:hypothetical protein
MNELTRIREFVSQVELNNYINKVSNINVLIGQDAESPRKYYAFTNSNRLLPTIGVVSSGLGAKPKLVELGKGGKLFVGHDFKLTAVDSTSGQILFVIQLNGVFFEFIDCGEEGQIAIHELGAIKVNAQGKCQWNVDTDVVGKFEMDDEGLLILHTMEGDSINIDTRSGRKI